jgi:hypothetical protein
MVAFQVVKNELSVNMMSLALKWDHGVRQNLPNGENA